MKETYSELPLLTKNVSTEDSFDAYTDCQKPDNYSGIALYSKSMNKRFSQETIFKSCTLLYFTLFALCSQDFSQTVQSLTMLLITAGYMYIGNSKCKSELANSLLAFIFLAAIIFTANSFVGIILVSCSTLKTRSFNTQIVTAFFNFTGKCLFAIYLSMVIAAKDSKTIKKIYQRISNISGFLILAISLVVVINYNKLISINPEFYRIESLIIENSIQTGLKCFVILSVLFAAFVINFVTYKNTKKVNIALYLSIVVLLISLLMMNNTGIKSFFDRYEDSMKTNCSRLIENTHETALKNMGICDSKYNYGNQALNDFSQKKLIWENYGVTYKEDYALINTKCCSNIESFYNTPFVTLETSVYMIISIQICLVFLPLLYLIITALGTTENRSVDSQRVKKQKSNCGSYIKLALTLVVAFSVIAISLNESDILRKTTENGVNNNMVQFFDNLKSNVKNELEPKSISGTFLALFNLSSNAKQSQDQEVLLNQETQNNNFVAKNQKVSVQGAINKSFGCRNITVESRLKNGTLLGETSVDKLCRFEMMLSTYKNTAFINDFKPSTTYEGYRENKRVHLTSDSKELDKDLIKEYKNLSNLNTETEDFEDLIEYDPETMPSKDSVDYKFYQSYVENKSGFDMQPTKTKKVDLMVSREQEIKDLKVFANAYNKLTNSSKSQSYSSSTDGISGPSKETQTTVVTANPEMNINGTNTEYDSYGNSSVVSESWVKSKAGKVQCHVYITNKTLNKNGKINSKTVTKRNCNPKLMKKRNARNEENFMLDLDISKNIADEAKILQQKLKDAFEKTNVSLIESEKVKKANTDIFSDVKNIYNNFRKMFSIIETNAQSENKKTKVVWQKFKKSLSEEKKLLWSGDMKKATKVWNEDIKPQAKMLGGDINELFNKVTDQFTKLLNINGKDWISSLEGLLKSFGDWISTLGSDVLGNLDKDFKSLFQDTYNKYENSKKGDSGKKSINQTHVKVVRTYLVQNPINNHELVNKIISKTVFFNNDLLFRKVTEGPFVDLDNLKLNERTMKSYRTKQNLTKNDIVLNFYDKNIQQKPLNKIDLDSFASNNLFVKKTKVEGVNTGLVNLKTFPEIKKLNMMRVSAHDMFTKELLSDYEVLLREGWSKNTGRIVKDHYNGDKKSETAFTDIPYGYYHLKIAKDGYDAQEILISFDRSGLVYPFYLKRSSVIGNAIVMNWVDGKQDFNLNLKLHNVKTGEKCSCNAENEFCPTAMFVRDRKQNEAGFEYVFTMPHKDWKMMAYAFVRPNSEKKATKKINLKSRNRTAFLAS